MSAELWDSGVSNKKNLIKGMVFFHSVLFLSPVWESDENLGFSRGGTEGVHRWIALCIWQFIFQGQFDQDNSLLSLKYWDFSSERKVVFIHKNKEMVNLSKYLLQMLFPITYLVHYYFLASSN